ncbi:peptide deformylase [Anaeromyxobacter paludicola]|uniref:Peptide deformylase n=1 Tax=Anaeromyxobacter paludicola TaxID=2918171 RepID=A0ABM7XEX9_9BACT|nr:peptide deformylase [Anaeromyxobacter paludicola]BDG10447.1 peptide deformylase [Anaeromyxobacter paludicola]
MIREIVIWPDPVLKKVAKPVDAVDDGIRRLLDDMSETMYAADGVGLAAPQIGVDKRCIVIDTSPRQEGQKLIHLVNPVIVKAEGETTYTEGCLSIPGEAEDVDRFAKVWVRALDYSGKPFELECDELLAIAAQHEHDHLEGTLFVDHLSSLKRELIRRRMKKLKQDRAAEKAEDIKTAAKHKSAL